MNLLFVDEAQSEWIGDDRLVALTGVLVPVGQYDAARTLFFRLLSGTRDLAGTIVTTRGGRSMKFAPGTSVREIPPELHGRRLLPAGDDDQRISACEAVARVVNETELSIFRASLRLSRSVWGLYDASEQRYFESWLILEDTLAPVLAGQTVVPVFDRGNDKFERCLTGWLHGRDFLKSHYPDPPLAGLPENRLNEIFVADSETSVLMQVADVVSYLLLQRDMLDSGWEFKGEFKRRLVAAAELLAPRIGGELRGQWERRDGQRSLAPY